MNIEKIENDREKLKQTLIKYTQDYDVDLSYLYDKAERLIDTGYFDVDSVLTIIKNNINGEKIDA